MGKDERAFVVNWHIGSGAAIPGATVSASMVVALVREATSLARCITSLRMCFTSLPESVMAATVGVATSMTLSAMSASLLHVLQQLCRFAVSELFAADQLL